MNASGRLNTCKSNGNIEKLAFLMTSGARVSNAYTIYLSQGYSSKKFELIPHGIYDWHQLYVKVSAVIDEYASY